MHATENMSALEVVLTKLHAGGKFDKDSYKYSAGLHGVGLSVVNALSEYLEVEVRRDGQVYFQRYERGVKMTELKVVGETKKTGTKVRFLPDVEIFESMEFTFDILLHRLRDLSFLNKGIRMKIVDERNQKEQEFEKHGRDRRLRHLSRREQDRHLSRARLHHWAARNRSISSKRPFSTTTATVKRRIAS